MLAQQEEEKTVPFMAMPLLCVQNFWLHQIDLRHFKLNMNFNQFFVMVALF